MSFSPVSGPGTIVNLVFGDLGTGETLDVDTIGSSDLVTSAPLYYLLEHVTVPASPTQQTAYQATPVPMPTGAWSVFIGVRISGGSISRPFTRVAIAL